MEPSQNKSENSPKNYKTMEEFSAALNKELDRRGIIISPNVKEDRQEPTSNSGEEVYEIRFFPKKEK